MLITSFLPGNCFYRPKGYYSGDDIRKEEMGGLCSTYGERRSLYRGLV